MNSEEMDNALALIPKAFIESVIALSPEQYFALEKVTILNQPSLEATYQDWLKRQTTNEEKRIKKCLIALKFLKTQKLIKACRREDSIYLDFPNIRVAANRNQIEMRLEYGSILNFIGKEWQAIDTLRNATREQLDAALKSFNRKPEKQNEK